MRDTDPFARIFRQRITRDRHDAAAHDFLTRFLAHAGDVDRYDGEQDHHPDPNIPTISAAMIHDLWLQGDDEERRSLDYQCAMAEQSVNDRQQYGDRGWFD